MELPVAQSTAIRPSVSTQANPTSHLAAQPYVATNFFSSAAATPRIDTIVTFRRDLGLVARRRASFGANRCPGDTLAVYTANLLALAVRNVNRTLAPDLSVGAAASVNR